jgi:hypothetical protein
MINKLFIIIIIIFLLIILFFINKYIKSNNYEHFCKIPDINRQGSINNKNVLLNYPPQSNILTSSCDKYWKTWPIEYNSMLSTTEPVVMNLDQLELAPEKQIGDSTYKKGLIDFYKLANIVSDKIDFDIFDKLTEKLISPIDNKPIQYKYEFDYIILELNKKTSIDRWQKYNPSVKMHFNYEDIKSPIETINILNLEFKKRCDLMQKYLLSKQDLVEFGLLLFDIFEYKIIYVKYLDDDINIPVYIIQISLFRELDLYLNTLSYIGYIKDNKIMIVNVDFVGINSTDNFLLAHKYDKNDIKQEIINYNFSNKSVIEKEPSAIVNLTKKYLDSYKLKNQYACFNLNYDPELKNEYLLPYFSRETCESGVDPYGRPKPYGVYDKPCQKNEECPYYKLNKNYDNEYGKCINGTCQLPLNMEVVGYHYYKTNKNTHPLCYNCNSKEFKLDISLEDCCNDQYNTNKYPFLKSPDYAFHNDKLDRMNYFDNKFCKININSDNNKYNCDKIIITEES